MMKLKKKKEKERLLKGGCCWNQLRQEQREISLKSATEQEKRNEKVKRKRKREGGRERKRGQEIKREWDEWEVCGRELSTHAWRKCV